MKQNIKCCQILGSIAGSFRGSTLRVFAHVCAVSALSVGPYKPLTRGKKLTPRRLRLPGIFNGWPNSKPFPSHLYFQNLKFSSGVVVHIILGHILIIKR